MMLVDALLCADRSNADRLCDEKINVNQISNRGEARLD